MEHGMDWTPPFKPVLEQMGVDAAVIMDFELQHPLRSIFALLCKWQEGYEIVSPKRVTIDEQPLARRLGSWLFVSAHQSHGCARRVSAGTCQ